MAQVKRSILIRAPLQKVHALARDPARWPKWFTGMGRIERVTGEGAVGTVAQSTYVTAGIRFPVTVEVREDHIGREGARFRARIDGPLAGEDTWIFLPKNGDTEVTMDVQYTVPGRILGKIANRLLLMAGVHERVVEQALQNLKLLCEAE